MYTPGFNFLRQFEQSPDGYLWTNELVIQSAGRVRQRVAMVTSSGRTATLHGPGIYYALKSLFLHLAANKGNPDLYFDVLPGSSNEGLVNGACTLYAVYLKKGAVATAAYYKISNHATVVQAISQVILESHTAGEEVLAMWPDGKTFTTGIAAGSYTAYDGSNVTTASTATHELSGFAIVGA